MKKLLGLLAASGLVVTSGIVTVACGSNTNVNDPQGAFQLATKNINVIENVPIAIEVQNFDILVDEALPTVFEHDLDGVIDVKLNQVQKALIFTLIDLSKTEIGAELSVTIKQKQNKYQETVKLKVVEANAEEFELAGYEFNYATNAVNAIKVINFDYLASANFRPVNFSFDKANVATAELDSANKEIIIKTNSQAVSNLKLTITDVDNTVSKIVTINIAERVIDLAANIYQTNILAGRIVDGNIDVNQEIGSTNYQINAESIIDSFNIVNNLNLSVNDVRIDEIQLQYQGGVGDVYEIVGTNNRIVKNSVAITTNQGIDPKTIMNNWNIGEVKLFAEILSDLDTILNTEDHFGKYTLIAVLLESVGARNKLMEYIKPTMLGSGMMTAMEMTTDSSIGHGSLTLKMPSFNGIFIEGEVEFSYVFVNEDRVTFLEGWVDENKVSATQAELDDALVTISGRNLLQERVYEILDPAFKNKVSLAEFKEFTKFRKKLGNFLLEVLPGSDYLYAHDQMGFLFFIGGLWNENDGFPEYKPNDKYIVAIRDGFNIFDII